MHVAINGWFWDQENTGSGQYLRYLLQSMRRVAPQIEFTLIVPSASSLSGLPEGVNVISTNTLRGNLSKIIFEQWTFPRVVKKVGADLAHVPYWGAPLSSPVPLITSVLDIIPALLPDYAANFKAKLYVSLVTASARGSSHILTISNASKTDIVKHLGIAEDLVTTTYLAANEAYHPRMGAEHDAEVKAKYQLPDEFVLYLGGFDLRKQVNQLLLAYTYVGQAEGEHMPLVIAGQEPEWGSAMFPDLKAYASELDITDYVHWIGRVAEEDKPSLYRLAKVFVYPSVYEGFGLPPLEAMQSGTAVVASDIAVMDEICGNAAYLVEAGNSRRMAGAILALLMQDNLREDMQARGLARATHFQWRKTARETIGVYEKVFAETHKS